MAFAARRKPLATATNQTHNSMPQRKDFVSPKSPVFDKHGSPPSAKQGGFVIRAWQHPSGLRSPPKVNAKFAPMSVAMAGSTQHPAQLTGTFERSDANAVPPETLFSRDSLASGARPSADPATPVHAVAAEATAPTSRELYRRRWIRTYEEHSSLLRSNARAVSRTSVIDSGATLATATQTATQTREMGTEALQSAPEYNAVGVQSLTTCDVGTQTDIVATHPAITQTTEPAQSESMGDVSVSEPGTKFSESGVIPGESSAAQQLATMAVDVQPPSMEELERLETLLQAEHQKIMGRLGDEHDQPWSSQYPTTSSRCEWGQNQSELVVAENGENREKREDIYGQFEEHEMGTMHADDAMHLFANRSMQDAQDGHSSSPVQYDSSRHLDDSRSRNSGQTVEAADNGGVEVADAQSLSSKLPGFSVLTSTSAMLTLPPQEPAGVDMRPANVPATPPRNAIGTTRRHAEEHGSPNSDTSDQSMCVAQTSLESLAELEALLEEQHKQLIARGLIPADTPNNVMRQ